MRILQEAGLPDGVINLVYVSGVVGEVCFNHKEFAGVHFTRVPQGFSIICGNDWKNMAKYRSYPRIVGETGGKDFVMVHKSANADIVATALLQGAFEFQGKNVLLHQGRISSNLWAEVKHKIIEGVNSFKMGH